MCMYIYIHTYIHTYMHACMHAYIHTYIHTYIGLFSTVAFVGAEDCNRYSCDRMLFD